MNAILGVDYLNFKMHIEKQFIEGMNWNNQGRKDDEWQIDHITPLATAVTEDEIIALCYYTNLRPLWAEDNRRRNNES